MDADVAGGLDEAAEELYGMTPELFTAERDALSARLRAQGRRGLAAQVKTLRRPVVAAWLVNMLVRHRGAELEQLLELGAAMRQAQAAMDTDQLRDLGRRRQAVVAAVGRQARALAHELGRPVTDQVVEAVEGTLRAALADPGAAAAVRTGRLTVALSYAGFGEVDLTGAVAAPAQPGSVRPAEGVPPAAARPAEGVPAEGVQPAARRRELAAARATLEAARLACSRAEAAARRAAAHRDATAARAATARQRTDAAQVRVDELEQVLAAARNVLALAQGTWTPLQAAADAAAELARQAEVDVTRARQEEAAAQAAHAAVDGQSSFGRIDPGT